MTLGTKVLGTHEAHLTSAKNVSSNVVTVRKRLVDEMS
jgi:hypothetical protein